MSDARDPLNPTDTSYDLLEVADGIEISSQLTCVQHRITDVHDYRILGSAHENDLIHLYSSNCAEGDEQIVRCGAYDHTMFESIDEYCSQKFPVEAIKTNLLQGCKFEVHGIFPSHFPRVASRLGYTGIREVRFSHNHRVKKFNYMRPRFYECTNRTGRKVLIVAVSAGRDYVFHYASMLKHVISMYSVQTADKIVVMRYPHAESSIHVWTGLDGAIVKQGDLVVLGYVEEVATFLSKDVRFTKSKELDVEYYTSTRYTCKKSGVQINLIGIKFSFWGCISAKIITQLCRLGVNEVIYVGKLGTLSSPADIYTRIYVPSEYLIMYHDKIVCRIQDQKNKLLEYCSDLDTNLHVSVPTVVEEDYIQREVTTNLQISSIDNEVSQMAYAVARYNQDFARDISFSAMHFATDYIRKPSERSLRVEFDLSNNRTKSAFKCKADILDRIAKRIADYLEER